MYCELCYFMKTVGIQCVEYDADTSKAGVSISVVYPNIKYRPLLMEQVGFVSKCIQCLVSVLVHSPRITICNICMQHKEPIN